MRNERRVGIVRALIYSDENIFSFFSAVISNIPISILLTVDKNITGNIVLYWVCFGSIILLSCTSAFLLLVFAIKKIRIKDVARKAYDEEVLRLGQSIEKLYQTHLEEEYEKNYKLLKVLFFSSVVCLFLTLVAIVGLWITK